MLDGLLGRGYAPKCKSLIKLTKSRIDVMRRKRNATIKFLKKDLADLLANGLDVNAYGRAGGLLDELRHLWNLDFVEKSCDFVYKQLSIMQKTRECPEACREAVSSLMFAAAGFSELPELRDLRHMFHERYEDSLELFVNQEFVENLSSKPFCLEKKVKLMEDVAAEFSIRWDSQAFVQRISGHNASVKDQPKNYGPLHSANDKHKSNNGNEAVGKSEMYGFSSKQRSEAVENRDMDALSLKEKSEAVAKREMHDLSCKERPQGSNDWHRLNGKKDDASERTDLVFQSIREDRNMQDRHKNNKTATKGYRHAFSSKERSESTNNGCRLETKDNEAEISKVLFRGGQDLPSERDKSPCNNGDTLPTKVKHENFFQGRRQENCSNHETRKREDIASRTPRSSTSKRRMEKVDTGLILHNGCENRENTIPLRENPDGLIQSKSKDKDLFGGNNSAGEYGYGKSTRKVQEEEDPHKPKHYFNNALPPPYVKPNGKPKNYKLEALEYSNADCDGNAVHNNDSRQVFARERSNGLDDRVKLPDDCDDVGEKSLPKGRSSRRKHSKSSSRDDFANPEDPGVVKRRSTRSRRRENSRRGLQLLFDDEHNQDDEEERIIDKLLMHYSKKPTCYEEVKVKTKSISRHGHRNVGADEGEPMCDDMSEKVHPVRSISLPHEQGGPSESTKVFARAASFQPDRSSAARHVHPKLPDYDDLAARFASLKGR